MKKTAKKGAGRPSEGRVKIMVYVLPDTMEKIRASMNDTVKTYGQAIDAKFGVKSKRR